MLRKRKEDMVDFYNDPCLQGDDRVVCIDGYWLLNLNHSAAVLARAVLALAVCAHSTVGGRGGASCVERAS